MHVVISLLLMQRSRLRCWLLTKFLTGLTLRARAPLSGILEFIGSTMVDICTRAICICSYQNVRGFLVEVCFSIRLESVMLQN